MSAVQASTPVERELLSAAAAGTELDLSAGQPADDDPSQGAEWDASRTVSGAFLSALWLGTSGPVHPRGIRLRGARITDQLDIESAEAAYPLRLAGCWFEQPLLMTDAQVPALRLPGCHVPGLHGKRLTVHGNLELNEGFRTEGEVGLLGARIGGLLSLSEASLHDPDGSALTCDGLQVEGDMFFRSGFSAEGEVRLLGAHIGGQLSFRGASLRNPDGPALSGDGLQVEDDLFCDDGFSAQGEVRLLGARISGQLSFAGASLRNPDRPALNGDRLQVEGHMLCREGFSAEGEISLLGAHVGGQLSFSGASLRNPDGSALGGHSLQVEGGLFCDDGFLAQGEIGLISARIGTVLSFIGASLQNSRGPVLNGERLRVEGNVLCREGFVAQGEVRLVGAQIAGQLSFIGASLRNLDGLALDCENAVIGESLLLRSLAHRPDGLVDLTRMRVATLVDDPGGWAPAMRFDGLEYDTIHMLPWEQRRDWLDRDPDGFFPQPYEQLAAVYRRTGHDEQARRVAIAKQDRRLDTLRGPAQWWQRFLRLAVGYGYQPWRAALWTLALVIPGTILALLADRAGAGLWLGDDRPRVVFPLWALDVVIPEALVVNLYQQQFWIPSTDHWLGWLALAWYWLAIPAGWALIAVAAAALTGILRKD